MVDCTLVTCDWVPALDPDDRLLMDELQRRGLTVAVAVWADARFDWSSTRIGMLRSTWDYHERYDEFVAWLERAAAATVIKNDPHLVRWNAHKSYLRDLEACGVPVVPTVWVPRGSRRSLAEIRAARGWSEVVLKPARGAAAHQVMHVRADAESLRAGDAAFAQLAFTQDVLAQPYLRSVLEYGERALIFFEGRYSHAVAKKPFDSVLEVGDARSAATEATPAEVEVATRAVQAVPGFLPYARVDLLRDKQGGICVSEVELIEPGLYFGAHERAAATFADVIERVCMAAR